MEQETRKNHWDNTYQKNPLTSLGWYEENSEKTLNLIEVCNLPKDALLFNAGAGATTLIQDLLKKNFTNIIVNDISSVALSELRKNLSIPKNVNLNFLVDDLTNPTELLKLKNVDLWNDRAVLHFFTSEEEQTNYFNLLKAVVKNEGYVILAEFNTEGAKKCSGLDVFNYNEIMLQERLGEDFKLLKAFNHTYIQPSGNPREFVYTLFQRKA
ncbi:methyltransferase domain-containing protein [Lutibacter sp.]|uniref:methyltransferase domain-containing protein n=1 Tax=Lutibacter sp. TaxID=1925666 RepID=UPI0025B8AB60|nr:methyltransferase domain-containing protein [Lutibacter sp.]MCF6182423.1 class I SAM-dependent methyltransferase [Lutibacter sp.]